MTIAPRACSCGSWMSYQTITVDRGHAIAGVYLCAHCDRVCTRAQAACGPCLRMKVKR